MKEKHMLDFLVERIESKIDAERCKTDFEILHYIDSILRPDFIDELYNYAKQYRDERGEK